MNLCPMPDGATQAHDRYQDEMEAAEILHEQRTAMWPIEDFEAEGWQMAMDNQELLHYLVAEVPTTVLYVLLARTNSAPDWLDVNAPDCEHLLSRLIAIWIEDQQERLQEEAVEAST